MHIVDDINKCVPYRGYARLALFFLSPPCPSVRSSGPQALSILRRKLSSLDVCSLHVLYSGHDCEAIENLIIIILKLIPNIRYH